MISTPTPLEIQSFYDGLVRETNFYTIYTFVIIVGVVVGLICTVLLMRDWGRGRWKYIFPVLILVSPVALVIVAWLDLDVERPFYYFDLYLTAPHIEQAWFRAVNTSDVAGNVADIGGVFLIFLFVLGLAGIFKNWLIKKPNHREAEVEAELP